MPASLKVGEMLIYQIKVGIRPYKPDEFIDSMRSIISNVRSEAGCIGFSVYKDAERVNTYSLVGEWKTQADMERHFKTNDFKVLIGAARVLGEAFEMDIFKVTRTGGIEIAKESINLTGINAVGRQRYDRFGLFWSEGPKKTY